MRRLRKSVAHYGLKCGLNGMKGLIGMAAAFCSRCGAALRDGDNFCSQCGCNIAPDVANTQSQQDGMSQFAGPNRILFRQDSSESLFEASFTDNTATQLADVVQTLVGARILRPTAMHAIETGEPRIRSTRQLEPGSDTVEAAPVEPHSAFDPPIAESSHDDSGDTATGIAQVFIVQHGEIRLSQPALKARTPAEYATRATRLFLYYMQRQNGVAAVPKSDVYDFLRAMSLKSTNFLPLISKDKSIERAKTTLKLNFAGEQQVARYLDEMRNPDLDDGWYPGKDERTSLTRKRMARKRKAEAESTETAEAVEWVSEVRELRELIKSRHQEVVQWQTSQIAMLGLYTVRKQYGDDHDISYRLLSGILYSLYELSVPEDNIRRALDRLKNASTKYVNPGRNRGYRISPSGVRHIEQQLEKLLNGERNTSGQAESQPGLFGTDADTDDDGNDGISES